jgi:hypothetical protein
MMESIPDLVNSESFFVWENDKVENNSMPTKKVALLIFELDVWVKIMKVRHATPTVVIRLIHVTLSAVARKMQLRSS